MTRAAPAARRRRRWIVLGVSLAAILAAALLWGVPYGRAYFTEVSTDDAYVNGYVTMVAPRVEDNVVDVLVDEGYYVDAGAYWMAHTNLEIGPWQLVWPRVVQMVGAGICFAPMNTAAYAYLPREQNNYATGLYNLL